MCKYAFDIPWLCSNAFFFFVTALANTVGSAVQGVENVVCIETVRRRRLASAHKKTSEPSRAVWKICQPGLEVRSRHAGHDGISLFPAKGIAHLYITISRIRSFC